MGKPILNKEQSEWIYSQLQIMAPYEVLESLNNKYGLDISADQFKHWRANHKITGKIRKSPYVGTCTIFSPEHEAYIHAHYMEWDSRVLVNELNQKYGTNFTYAQVRSYRQNRKLYSKQSGGYCGMRPNPHKGQRGWCVPNSEKTRFKEDSPIIYPGRWVVIRKSKRDGARLWIKDGNEWQLMSRWVWKKNNGLLNEGDVIKHLNNDCMDCRLENLALVSREIMGYCTSHKYHSENPDITQLGINLATLSIQIQKKE